MELELRGEPLAWVLGTELRFSEREASVHNCWDNCIYICHISAEPLLFNITASQTCEYIISTKCFNKGLYYPLQHSLQRKLRI